MRIATCRDWMPTERANREGESESEGKGSGNNANSIFQCSEEWSWPKEVAEEDQHSEACPWTTQIYGKLVRRVNIFISKYFAPVGSQQWLWAPAGAHLRQLRFGGWQGLQTRTRKKSWKKQPLSFTKLGDIEAREQHRTFGVPEFSADVRPRRSKTALHDPYAMSHSSTLDSAGLVCEGNTAWGRLNTHQVARGTRMLEQRLVRPSFLILSKQKTWFDSLRIRTPKFAEFWYRATSVRQAARWGSVSEGRRRVRRRVGG